MAFHKPGAMKPTPPMIKALKSVVWYQVRPVTLTEAEARSTSAILKDRGDSAGRRLVVVWASKRQNNGNKQTPRYNHHPDLSIKYTCDGDRHNVTKENSVHDVALSPKCSFSRTMAKSAQVDTSRSPFLLAGTSGPEQRIAARERR